MRNLMRRFANEGRGVLVSSHMLSEVSQTVDDIVIIARGRTRNNAPISDYVEDGRSLEDAFFATVGHEGEYRARD